MADETRSCNRKAQTNALIIVFFIVIFLGAAMFLFVLGGSADTAAQDEYMNMYANSLLVTLMKTDTGLEGVSGSRCGTISDMAFYSLFYASGCNCLDASGRTDTCRNWLDEKISGYFSDFSYDPDKPSFYRQGFDYCLVLDWGGNEISFGEASLIEGASKRQKWAAELTMFKAGNKKLETNLVIAKGDD